MSVRARLALSYAAVVMLAGVILLGIVWLFLLRYVPARTINTSGGFVPNRTDLLNAFAPAAGLALLVLLVLGLVGGCLLAGRVLAPLARITEATRAASAGSLSHRIELGGRADEFRELADAFDAALERLERHVGEQRRFAANASHELRTPLAISQTLLEVARRDPSVDTAALVTRLESVNARAIHLTGALLLLSRADDASFEREHVDLSLATEEAVETLLPLAEERGVDIDLDADAAPTAGSPALLVQLTTNLVQNAIVHNLRDAGWLRVRTGTRDGLVELTIENAGAHLAPDTVSTLTEPSQRGALRVRDAGDGSGVGLGLAIVASIVRAHRGTLTLTSPATGGLRVVVTLPAAAESSSASARDPVGRGPSADGPR